MSSLDELVRFRSLADQLNDEEYRVLVSQLFAQTMLRRDFLDTAIFNHFQGAAQPITPITDMVTNIIISRDSSTELETEESHCDRLDKLPAALIGECASFLAAEQYFRFGHTNRKVYTSIHSAPRIHALDNTLFHKNPACVCMNALRNMQRLWIQPRVFLQFLGQHPELQWTHTLHALTHVGLFHETLHFTNQLLNDPRVSLQQVKRLDLFHFEDDLPSLFKLLAKFPALEYLELQSAYGLSSRAKSGVGLAVETIRALPVMKRIKHLDIVVVSDVDARLLRALQGQLETLHYVSMHDQAFAFRKLKYILLRYPGMQFLSSLQSVSSIKSASLASPVVASGVDKRVSREFIKQMIGQQPELEYLGMHVDLDWAWTVMKDIEVALSRASTRQSDSLFIELDIEVLLKAESDQALCRRLYLCAVRLINALNMTTVTSWRLKFTLNNCHKDLKKSLDDVVKELALVGTGNCQFVHKGGRGPTDAMLVISSKDCTFGSLQTI